MVSTGNYLKKPMLFGVLQGERERVGVRQGTRIERGTRLYNVPGERERETDVQGKF
jgi:hypothetical protein